jgi:hypothetical protein
MANDSDQQTKNTPDFEILHPREKGRWQKLGVAFRNKDSSITMLIEYVPVGGVDGRIRLQLRPYESPRDSDDAHGQGPGERGGTRPAHSNL